jgi:dienelactone hydrolase
MRISALLLAACLAPAPVLADSVPSAPFTALDAKEHGSVVQVKVTYPAGTETVQGWLFLPAGQEAGPALIFCHPGFGVDDRVAGRCRDLAEAGYTVLAPEYRIQQAPRFTVTPGEVERILAGDALLRRHTRVNPHQVGIVGSSHGSLLALLAVADTERNHFRAAVHACGDRSAQNRAADIKCPVLVQVGKRDQEVDYQEGRFMAIDLRTAGNSGVTIKEYTLAGHDFWFWTDPATFTIDEIAQGQWAWEDMLDFVGRYLTTGAPSAAR